MPEEAPRFESSDVVSMFPTLVWKLAPDAGTRAGLDRRIRTRIEALVHGSYGSVEHSYDPWPS